MREGSDFVILHNLKEVIMHMTHDEGSVDQTDPMAEQMEKEDMKEMGEMDEVKQPSDDDEMVATMDEDEMPEDPKVEAKKEDKDDY